MSKTTATPSAAQQLYGDIAPQLADYSGKVLNRDLWERPQLSQRDRSLITCAALVCMSKTEQMSTRFPRAIANGVTKDELVETITHLAFIPDGRTPSQPLSASRNCSGPKEEQP